MAREGEAPEERRGGKSSKRRRKEDNSSSRMDDESAATSKIEEDETSEEESATMEIEEGETSEDEEGNSTPTEMDLEGLGPPLTDEDILTSYRECWEYTWGDEFGDFEQTTTVSSTLCTYRTIKRASVTSAVQVYSMKVVKTKLMWPLQVYGLVAARDTVDHNRNLLFYRERDNCQIITEKDPYLLLTGPSRAIVLINPVDFEIQLKVKGESEDKEALITQFYRYTGTNGWPLGIRWSNNLCRIDLHFKKLISTVQATIMHARVGGGSWPSEYRGTVVAGDFSSSEDIVLLDFPDGTKAPVDSDGYLDLSRRVISVDSEKGMRISVKAYSMCGDKKVTACSDDVMFTPQKSGLTQLTCHLDDNFLVEIEVAWSLLVVAKPPPEC